MNTRPRIDIPLAVVGCDFRIAPSAVRGGLLTTAEGRHVLVEAIRNMEPAAGIAVLETCNRVEWIVSSRNPQWTALLLAARMLTVWRHRQDDGTRHREPYRFAGAAAAEHVMRVVAGLESLAAGEAQIAGQFQKALSRAQKEKASSLILNGLASSAGRVAKASHRIGFRVSGSVGVHGLVASLLRAHFGGETRGKKVLVAGMGEIGRKCVSLIETTLGCSVTPVNRTVSSRHARAWRRLDEVPALAPSADAIVVATGAPVPVLTLADLALAPCRTPLLVVDIGIPGQVEVPERPGDRIVYRNLDDLLRVRSHADHLRHTAEVEAEIQAEVGRFKRFCIERNMVSLLEAAHQQRRDFMNTFIPSLIDQHLADLDGKERQRVQLVMQRLVRRYSNDMFASIHAALEEHWKSL